MAVSRNARHGGADAAAMMDYVPHILLIAPVGFIIGILISLPTGPTNLLGL
jgi:hypothetical protein